MSSLHARQHVMDLVSLSISFLSFDDTVSESFPATVRPRAKCDGGVRRVTKSHKSDARNSNTLNHHLYTIINTVSYWRLLNSSFNASNNSEDAVQSVISRPFIEENAIFPHPAARVGAGLTDRALIEKSGLVCSICGKPSPIPSRPKQANISWYSPNPHFLL
jgi:hypothetical protein